MTKRENKKFQILSETYGQAVDEGLEMFFEQRPIYWGRLSITKPREDIEECIKENEMKKRLILKEIGELLSFSMAEEIFNEKATENK